MAIHKLLEQEKLLTSIVAAAWLVLSAPAWYLAGPVGLAGLTCAALLCLVPGWLVLAAAGLYGVSNSSIQFVLLGTAGRLLFVLGGVLVLQRLRPDFGLLEFFVWLIAFYFVTLAAETWILLRRPES